MRRVALGSMLAATSLLSGCVAAAVPIAAAGAIGRHAGKDIGDRKAERRRARKQAAAAQARPAAPAPGVPTPASGVSAGMLYLYGSGEAAALDVQAYLGLMNYLVDVSTESAVGHPVASVVMAPGSTIDNPEFVPCGSKPLAVVLDIDETSILNLGFAGDQVANGGRYDQGRWDAWERTGTGAQVAAVPGAAEAVSAARRVNIAVVFNSNRQAANAAQTAALLGQAGLGPAVHGDTLWLQGDAPGGAAKDPRRWAIANRYCVIAMVGDQLGDFSDLFNAPGADPAARRRMIKAPHVAMLWGHGWFIVPNPVYGTGLAGGADDIFPADRRWAAPIIPEK